MTNEFRKKAVELGKLMNSKSKLSVPLVKCIIECFEIVFDEQDIDYMLLMKDGYYSRDELKELWQLDGEAFEKVFTSIRDKGGIWESRQEGVYDITPIFPGWVELYASGPLNDKRRRLLIKFAEFEELLIKLNIAPVRMYMNRVNERNMQREQGRMSTLIPDPANNLSAKKKINTIDENGNAVIKTVKQQIDELIEIVNLTNVADKKIGGFSGGMKQRVLLAQALLGDPKILILDEPTAGLDPKERINIRNYIAELSKDKIILFATHVVSDIECIADCVLLLKKGEIIAQGTPIELIEAMSGKVGEIKCCIDEVEMLQNKYKIGNIRQRKEGLALRIVGDELPEEAVITDSDIDLEDVYLYYFESWRKNGLYPQSNHALKHIGWI